jgi:hypothetical protein
MIKRYSQFIKESFGGFRTIGEYIENLSKDNDYALNIISQYTQDFDPKVRLANVVNLLPKSTQDLILKLIIDDKSGNEEPKEADVIAYTSANLNESTTVVGGKQVLQCFLKVITALGQKGISYNPENTPKDFIFYFETSLLQVDDVKSVMSRYQFFDKVVNEIDYTFNFCNLYYGIKTDGKFEYGIKTETEMLIIGQFDLTVGVLKYLLLLNSPSANGLKKQIATLNINQIKLLGKIKNSMENFNPGTFQKKMKPVITDNIISYSYYDENIDINEIENIKSNFKSFLIPNRWSDKIQVSVSVTGNNLFLNIKIK